MNETPREPSTAWWFGRKYFVPIVVGTMPMLLLLLGAACVYVPYQRERQIAMEIEATDGFVQFEFVGPDWIPEFICDRLPLWTHVTQISLGRAANTEAKLESLKWLSSLTSLELGETQRQSGKLW